MKAVLLSIRPNWCKLIWSGMKTLEVRRTRPKLETPFKVYVYCTKCPQHIITIFKDGEEIADGEIYHGKPAFVKCDKYLPEDIRNKTQAVIGEFICDEIENVVIPYPSYQNELDPKLILKSGVPYTQLHRYASSGKTRDDLFFWHISNFKLYEEPVRLKDFWAIQPCTHRGDCCTCRRWDAEKLICRGEVFGIERPPQSWCYVEDGR